MVRRALVSPVVTVAVACSPPPAVLAPMPGCYWRLLPGDTARLEDSRRDHRMALDSMHVTWAGFRGTATAWLASTPTGFEGLLQLGYGSPVSLPRARVTLTRTNCGGHQLISSALPHPVSPP